MNSNRSHNLIKAILFALTATLVMTGSAFAWGHVHAEEGTGSGAYSDMQNQDVLPAERVYGIYMMEGGDSRVYVEWLGETELSEDAVLVMEKKEEMTEEEAAEYQTALDELIENACTGNEGPGEDKGAGIAVPDVDESTASAGEPEEQWEDTTGEPGAETGENVNPDPHETAEAAPKDDAQLAAGQAAPMMNAANMPKENMQDTKMQDGGTRDVVPTGVFFEGKPGMILIVILIAFAAALFMTINRKQRDCDF